MVQKVQIKRTSTPNQPPPDGSLSPGELAVEMATSPPNLWVGVPTNVDATGKKLLAPGNFVKIPGDTMTGALTVQAQVTVDTTTTPTPNDAQVLVYRNTPAYDAAMRNPIAYAVNTPTPNKQIFAVDGAGRLAVTPTYNPLPVGGDPTTVRVDHDLNYDGVTVLTRVNITTGVPFKAISEPNGGVVFYVGYAGAIYSTYGSITVISDAAVKQEVTDIPYGLDAIKALRPLTYRLIANPVDVHYGFLAEEVQPILPELVENNTMIREGENTLTLREGSILPVLVKAIQELSAKVAALEAAR